MDGDAAKLATDIQSMVRALRLRLISESQPGGITPSQRSVLVALSEKAPWTQTELAARDRVRPQTMGTIVASLEELGLVRRRACEDDGRRINIELTAAGKSVLEQEREHRGSWLAQVLSSKLTPSERQQLSAALVLLSKIIDAD
jgi:DNA-binding MarR family transcriptional regulator